MSGLLTFEGLTEQGGVYLDPYKVTALTRILKNANSRAASNSLIVSTSPCLVFGFTVSSANAASQFIQLFDTATLPADGTVPTLVFPVQITSSIGNAFVPYPRAFKQGCVICNSSTQHTKTIGSADCIFDVQFV